MTSHGNTATSNFHVNLHQFINEIHSAFKQRNNFENVLYALNSFTKHFVLFHILNNKITCSQNKQLIKRKLYFSFRYPLNQLTLLDILADIKNKDAIIHYVLMDYQSLNIMTKYSICIIIYTSFTYLMSILLYLGSSPPTFFFSMHTPYGHERIRIVNTCN